MPSSTRQQAQCLLASTCTVAAAAAPSSRTQLLALPQDDVVSINLEVHVLPCTMADSTCTQAKVGQIQTLSLAGQVCWGCSCATCCCQACCQLVCLMARVPASRCGCRSRCAAVSFLSCKMLSGKTVQDNDVRLTCKALSRHNMVHALCRFAFIWCLLIHAVLDCFCKTQKIHQLESYCTRMSASTCCGICQQSICLLMLAWHYNCVKHCFVNPSCRYGFSQNSNQWVLFDPDRLAASAWACLQCPSAASLCEQRALQSALRWH